MIVSTAGVSVGTRDVIRVVVEEMGWVDFWGVNIRPGKPLVFGLVQDVPFLGLPGNPVSAMVTFEVFVRPALCNMQDLPSTREDGLVVRAVVNEPIASDGRQTYMRVRLEDPNGIPPASSTGTQSSGVLMSMVRADGLMIIPEGVTNVPAGSVLPVWLLRGRAHAFR